MPIENEWNTRLLVVTAQVKELLSTISAQRKEINELRTTNEKLLVELAARDKNIAELDERLKITKLARSFESGEIKPDLKRKINEYIKEVEYCLTLLNE